MFEAESVAQRGHEKYGLSPRRTSVTIGRHGKVWRDASADEVHPGDVVRGKGLVKDRIDDRMQGTVGLVCGEDSKPTWYDLDDMVYAFTHPAEEE